MDKLKNRLKSIPISTWVFLAILVLGIFLRTYHFSDWLFFQPDQSRDLNMISDALAKGPGALPLLGPRAGGTFLRLGPIFYYFQYISGKIFGLDQPWKAAYPDLFFSILTIPLFYLFLKEFFFKKWSLIITASYAVCFFTIQYSRFAWNPNSLPFFNLLFFYSLMKFFGTQEKKKMVFWTILAGFSYTIASQLHFVCFLSFPIATLIFIFFQKFILKIPIKPFFKYIPIAILIFIFLYIPVILSDIQTNGNNALNFLASFHSKSSDAEFFALIKIVAFNFSEYFAIIWSGIIDASKENYKLFFAFILAGIMCGGLLFWKEKNNKKKMFIATVFIWFFSYVIVYFPLGTKVQPRHFLPILPIPFIFWGFILFYINKINLKYKSFIIIPLLFLPLLLNAYSTKIWFSELNDSQVKISNPRKSVLLKSVGGEDWWHLKKTAEFIKNDCEKEQIVIVPPKKAYRSLLEYSMQNIKELRKYYIKLKKVEYDSNNCYYYMYFSKNNPAKFFDQQTKKINETNLGDISIIRFEISPQSLDKKSKEENPFREKSTPKEETIPSQNLDNSDITNESEDISGLNSIEVKREKRVFWADIFKN